MAREFDLVIKALAEMIEVSKMEASPLFDGIRESGLIRGYGRGYSKEYSRGYRIPYWMPWRKYRLLP
ncbi:hypothetical protein [Desulfofundulus thermocisternus]|uniref:hypothetical protein n=1 Tax=Desulfofundulus thermocisternus TaxID=42471 RepID=UPI00217D38EF|nr:hypothetical protein [Desulfofundulus thermocisternus]